MPSTDLYTVTQYEVIYYSEVAPDTPSSELTDALELTISTNEASFHHAFLTASAACLCRICCHVAFDLCSGALCRTLHNGHTSSKFEP